MVQERPWQRRRREYIGDCKTVLELNRDLAQKILKEGRNPLPPGFTGKYVGIANGRVVAAPTIGMI